MECYSVKKNQKPVILTFLLCQTMPAYAWKSGKLGRNACLSPRRGHCIQQVTHGSVRWSTWEWVKANAVWVYGESVSLSSSSEHADRTHLHCTNESFGIQKLQTQNFSSVSPFLSPYFYLKTGQTDVIKLLCLQSVSIPNTEAVSDSLNPAARQQLVEQHSSFYQSIKQKLKNSEFCHLSTLPFTYTRNTMCKSNLLGRAANLEQGEEKLIL